MRAVPSHPIPSHGTFPMGFPWESHSHGQACYILSPEVRDLRLLIGVFTGCLSRYPLNFQLQSQNGLKVARIRPAQFQNLLVSDQTIHTRG